MSFKRVIPQQSHAYVVRIVTDQDAPTSEMVIDGLVRGMRDGSKKLIDPTRDGVEVQYLGSRPFDDDEEEVS